MSFLKKFTISGSGNFANNVEVIPSSEEESEEEFVFDENDPDAVRKYQERMEKQKKKEAKKKGKKKKVKPVKKKPEKKKKATTSEYDIRAARKERAARKKKEGFKKTNTSNVNTSSNYTPPKSTYSPPVQKARVKQANPVVKHKPVMKAKPKPYGGQSRQAVKPKPAPRAPPKYKKVESSFNPSGSTEGTRRNQPKSKKDRFKRPAIKVKPIKAPARKKANVMVRKQEGKYM